MKHLSQVMQKRGLWLVLLVALVLRFYQLGSVPPSPSLDEVSIGYNAYSILKTGSDEYGTRMPLLLRAYDDYRPALYVYLVVPFVAVLGLIPAAVRLPAVLLSMLTVWLTYRLVRLLVLYYSHQERYTSAAEPIAVASAFLLAISPWHIYLSRLGHEVNAGLTFVVAGIYAFFMAIALKRPRWLLAAGTILGLSFYTYQSQKAVVPLLVLLLALLFGRELLARYRRHALAAVVIGTVLAAPMLWQSVTPEGMIRFRATTVFTDAHPLYGSERTAFMLAKQRGDIVAQIIHYHRLIPLKIFIGQYLSHFRPDWLFWGGAAESHKVPHVGLLYPWELPLIAAGMILLFRSRWDIRIRLFILGWLLSAAVPAAITTQAPHAMRSFTFLPVWQLVAGIALVRVLNRTAAVGGIMLSVLALMSVGALWVNYFQVFPVTHADSFQLPLRDAYRQVFTREPEFARIVISNEESLYQSYMFYLFYSAFDPDEYLRQGGTVSGGYAERHRIGKYEFRPIRPEEPLQPGVLYVGNVHDFDDGTTVTGIPNPAGEQKIVLKTL